MKSNLRNVILDAIESDDSFTEKNNFKIEKLFNSSSKAEQEKINELFINLCGFSLETLVSTTINQNSPQA